MTKLSILISILFLSACSPRTFKHGGHQAKGAEHLLQEGLPPEKNPSQLFDKETKEDMVKKGFLPAENRNIPTANQESFHPDSIQPSQFGAPSRREYFVSGIRQQEDEYIRDSITAVRIKNKAAADSLAAKRENERKGKGFLSSLLKRKEKDTTTTDSTITNINHIATESDSLKSSE